LEKKLQKQFVSGGHSEVITKVTQPPQQVAPLAPTQGNPLSKLFQKSPLPGALTAAGAASLLAEIKMDYAQPLRHPLISLALARQPSMMWRINP
jgi:hypothetical protein